MKKSSMPGRMLSMLFVLFLMALKAHAAQNTVFLLAYGDDLEEDVEFRGDDRKNDIERMIAIWRNVAQSVGYDFQPIANYSKGFNARQVKQDIFSLKPGNRDIIVFYYTGHGKSLPNSDYPWLIFKDLDNEPGLALEKVDELISARCASIKIRNIILIADCCNLISTIPIESAKGTANENPLISRMKSVMEQSKNQKFIVCAGKKGSPSFSDSHCYDNQCGSYWSMIFKRKFYNCSPSDNLHEVFNKTNNEVRNMRFENKTQEPVCTPIKFPYRFNVTFIDQLGPDQQREKVTIYLYGRSYTLEIDREHPSDEILIGNLPNGTTDYKIEIEIIDINGRIYNGSMSKKISIEEDGVFKVYSQQGEKNLIDMGLKIQKK